MNILAASVLACGAKLEALSFCVAHKASLQCSSCIVGSEYLLYPPVVDDSSKHYQSCDILGDRICSNLESHWTGCACDGGFCEEELESFYQCSMMSNAAAHNLDCVEDLCCFVGGSTTPGREMCDKDYRSMNRQHRKLFLGGPIQSIFDFFLGLLNLIDIFNIIPDPKDRPPIANDDAAITYENTSVVIDVLANDFDPDGDELKLAAIATKPSNGVAVINRNGTITYTPDLGFSGIDTFGYDVTTGEIQPTAAPSTALPAYSPTPAPSTTLSTDSPSDSPSDIPSDIPSGSPVPTPTPGSPDVGDDEATTQEGTSIVIDILDNDSDPDGDPLTITECTEPVNGDVVIAVDGGEVTYTPDANFTGVETFVCLICDDGVPAPLCNDGTVTVTVTGATPPPTPAPTFGAPTARRKISVQINDNDTPYAKGTLPPKHERALQTETDRARVTVTVQSGAPPQVCSTEKGMFDNCLLQSGLDNGCDGLCREGADGLLGAGVGEPAISCADQETQTCSNMKSHFELKCNNCHLCNLKFEVYYECLIKDRSNGQCGVDFTNTCTSGACQAFNPDGSCVGPPDCFSPFNIVDVKHKGAISITELQIGDLVSINEKGEYSRVYSLAHLDHTSKTNYLQVFAEGLRQPIEISPNHFLFVDNMLTPALMLKKGDILNGNGSRNKVSKITSVQRSGKYAPLTESGTIRVSGVEVSNYVSLTTILPGTLAHFSDSVPYCIHHIISHGWTAPLRWVCTLNFDICRDETYDNGYASWFYATLEFSAKLGKAPQQVQVGFALAVAPFLVALHSPLVVVTFAVFVISSIWSYKNSSIIIKTKSKS